MLESELGLGIDPLTHTFEGLSSNRSEACADSWTSAPPNAPTRTDADQQPKQH